ncbi:MAG: DUF3313 domain-containing protein [Desulfobacterota bacterium]|nr:DUF3313 domain-containing protein [Thermodesulfobacteriota bacterium]
MEKNRKLLHAVAIVIGMFAIIANGSCGAQQLDIDRASAVDQRRTTDNDSLMTLIPDYSGMTENESVAAAWIRQGFRLKQCRQFQILPVINYSRTNLSDVQEALQKDLEQLFAGRGDPAAGTVTAQVITAIIAARKKIGLFKRLSPHFDDIPSLTIEMIVVDADTKQILCKLCHAAKHEKFDRAYDALCMDLQRFFDRHL